MKGQALSDCYSAGRFANAALEIPDGHREAERPFRTALVRRRETNELLCFRERELTIASIAGKGARGILSLLVTSCTQALDLGALDLAKLGHARRREHGR